MQEAESKPGTLATVLAAAFLLCVIVYGIVRLRPEFQAVREGNKTVQAAPPPATPQRNAPPSDPGVTPLPTGNPPAAVSTSAEPDTPKASETEPADTAAPAISAPTPPAPRKSEPSISPAAAGYKHQIEEVIAAKNLGGRVKVNGTANTLTLSGKLRPAEHGALLKLMRNAPSNVHVVDDIQYDDSPVANTDAENGARPGPGYSAIHVATDVLGATATLYGPAGRELNTCQTPCSFSNLAPLRYRLQVQKEGYITLQTAVETKSGQSLDQKLHLEAVAKGLYVASRPAGADIFINGAKQSGQTPTSLPLGPGQYDLVLRLPGYEAYVGHIQVKDNIQTTLDAELKAKQDMHVAWAQVNSTPQGASIFIDGVPTDQVTPARVQVPTGVHTIGLRLSGYQTAKHPIQASEGGTVSVTETLHPK